MRSLLLIVTLLCFSLTVGCSSYSQAKEMVGGLYEKYKTVEGELAETKAEMAVVRATAEARHGSIDTDGDGEVSVGERATFAGKVAAGAAMGNQEDKDLMTNWKFWLMIAVGGPAATGGAVAARNILKKKVLNPADSG